METRVGTGEGLWVAYTDTVSYPEWRPAEGPAPAFEDQAETMGLDYVSAGPRFLAQGVDLLVHFGSSIFALAWTGVFIGLFFSANADAFLATIGSNKLIAIIFGMLGSIAYHTCMEGFHGSTVGKRLFGLQVLSVDGGRCSLSQAAKRSLAILWDGLFFGLIGITAINGDPQRQRHGDDWAETVVVRRGSVPPSSLPSGKEFFAAFLMGVAADSVFLALGHLATYALR